MIIRDNQTPESCDLCGLTHSHPFKASSLPGALGEMFAAKIRTAEPVSAYPTEITANELPEPLRTLLASFDTDTMDSDTAEPLFTRQEISILGIVVAQALRNGQRVVNRNQPIEVNALDALATLNDKLTKLTTDIAAGRVSGVFGTPF